MQVYGAFEKAEEKDDVHTIIIDSLTFLMAMYESMYVINSSNGLKAWGSYAEYFKNLMQKYIAASSKNVILTAHTSDVLNESEMVMETLVKIKGSIMNQGIESFFTTVIGSKKVPLKKLEGFNNPLLTITEEEEIIGIKYVFQTKLTKETVNERIRAPLGLWDRQHTYIDNDVQNVLDHIHNYYQA